jgi:hypothetical protein
MAVKATVTYTNKLGATASVLFYGFDDVASQSRFFIDYIPSGSTHDIGRFNAVGVDGNFLTRKGFRGSTVELIVRYRGNIDAIALLWQADRENFAKYSCAITDTVVPYTRCTLRANSGSRTTEELAVGATGNIFYDVRFLFDVEEE